MIERLPAMLDIEASGFGRGSYPIEIGAALENGEVFSMLVRPEPDWQHWDEQAESVHGISRELLISNGLPIREVAETLNQRLEGLVVYSDGWGFDSSWLSLLFYSAHKQQAFRLDTIARVMSEHQMQVWDVEKEKIRHAMQIGYHRAGQDAEVLQKTWLATRQNQSQVNKG